LEIQRNRGGSRAECFRPASIPRPLLEGKKKPGGAGCRRPARFPTLPRHQGIGGIGGRGGATDSTVAAMAHRPPVMNH